MVINGTSRITPPKLRSLGSRLWAVAWWLLIALFVVWVASGLIKGIVGYWQ